MSLYVFQCVQVCVFNVNIQGMIIEIENVIFMHFGSILSFNVVYVIF